jgi:CBS domain-containing protein
MACADHGGLAEDPVAHLERVACRRVGSARSAKRRQVTGEEAGRVRLSEIMTVDVLAVRPDVSLEAFADLLLERGIGGAPVVDEEGRPVGIASKTDVLGERLLAGDTEEAMGPGRQVSRGHYRVEVGPGFHAEALPRTSVADAMTHAAMSLPEDAPVAEAAVLLASRGMHRVPVVSGDGRVSGIVTSADIVRWVAEQAGRLPARKPAPRRGRGRR